VKLRQQHGMPLKACWHQQCENILGTSYGVSACWRYLGGINHGLACGENVKYHKRCRRNLAQPWLHGYRRAGYYKS